MIAPDAGADAADPVSGGFRTSRYRIFSCLRRPVSRPFMGTAKGQLRSARDFSIFPFKCFTL